MLLLSSKFCLERPLWPNGSHYLSKLTAGLHTYEYMYMYDVLRALTATNYRVHFINIQAINRRLRYTHAIIWLLTVNFCIS